MDREPKLIGLSRLHYPVTTLGPGRRAGIWFQGCSIHCRGCISLDTWETADGKGRVSTSDVVDWLSSLGRHALEGITISGGEPFDQAVGLHKLLLSIRRNDDFAGVDVLVYSGYPFSRLRRVHPAVLDLVDAVVSGPYVARRPTNLPWRGSSNQRLTVLNAEAAARYAGASLPEAQLQISADGAQLWITGIPRRGMLDELEEVLRTRGVRIEEVSWRS